MKALILTILLLPGSLRAENWPQWRGPLFNGSTSETNLPERWSKTENVAWTVPLPGPSGATPIVWRDSPFVSSPDPQTKIYCLSEAGTAVVINAFNDCKIISSISMGEAPVRSSIVAAQELLFIRTAKNLYCIGP